MILRRITQMFWAVDEEQRSGPRPESLPDGAAQV